MTPASARAIAKGLRQFLDDEQQRAWLEGEAVPPDSDRADFHETLEQRFKYAARFEKLLRLPQADDVLDILRLYAATALPIPRATERFYWSVSCLPSSPDRPLVRINAGWMELFALHACPERSRRGDGTDLRARIILHLSDFTTSPSPLGEGAEPGAEPGEAGEDDTSPPSRSPSATGSLPLPRERDIMLDQALLESLVERPGDVSHFLWKADTFGAKVRGAASIRKFLADPRGLRAVRRFNLTHMNRGRNAYQASHCYSLADAMLD